MWTLYRPLCRAHEAAHEFSQAGPGRGPRNVVCYCCYNMCDDEVYPAHEMAHAFLRAGPDRGPSYVLCGKYYCDDFDVRPAHARQPTHIIICWPRRGPARVYAVQIKNRRRRAVNSLFRSKKQQQQQARKANGFDTRYKGFIAYIHAQIAPFPPPLLPPNPLAFDQNQAPTSFKTPPHPPHRLFDLQDSLDKRIHFPSQLSDFAPLRNGFYSFRAQTD